MKTLLIGILASVAFCAYAQEKPLDLELKMGWSMRHTKLYESGRQEPEPRSDKEDKYDYSIGFGGWSNHKKKTKCIKKYCYDYRETNPTIEFDVWLDVELLGGRPFAGYGHVFDNSNRGTTDWVIAANQWKLVRGEYVDLIGGLGAMKAWYSVPKQLVKPGKPHRISKNLPVVYVGLEKGPFAMRFVPLGKDILFMYLIYSFR